MMTIHSPVTVIAQKALHPDWCPTYNHARIQLLLVLALQIALGARVGSIIHTGSQGYAGPEHANRVLCYGHCEFTINQPPPGQDHNKLIVKFTLWHTKTAEGWVSHMYLPPCCAPHNLFKGRSTALLERSPGYFNGPVLFLALALQDGAFLGDLTIDQILSPSSLEGLPTKLLPWKEEW